MAASEASAQLDTHSTQTTAWLVRVPAVVAKGWRTICNDSLQGRRFNSNLGTVLSQQTAEGVVSFVELPSELLQSTSEPLPKRLKLQPILLASEDSSRSYVVSYKALSEAQPAAQEPEQDDEDIEAQVPQPVQLMSSARVDGMLTQRLDLMPVSQAANGEWVVDDGYRSLVNKRVEAAANKGRGVQFHTQTKEHVLKNLEKKKEIETLQMRQMKALAAAAPKAGEAKAEKLDKLELEKKLFALFQGQAAWPFRQLQVTTKQPVAWLREVLDGIAAQARRGPHKDKYELKPEYRLTSSRAADAVEQ